MAKYKKVSSETFNNKEIMEKAAEAVKPYDEAYNNANKFVAELEKNYKEARRKLMKVRLDAERTRRNKWFEAIVANGGIVEEVEYPKLDG